MRNMHCLAALAVASTTLGGCALFPTNIDPPRSVFTDSSLAAPGPSASTQAPSQAPSQAASPAQTQLPLDTLITDLERDLVSSWIALRGAKSDTEAVLGNRFLVTGISLVDARCDRYFVSLGRAAQKLAFANKELGLTTGLVAALQGLTSVGSKEISITASGLGFLGASSTAYGDVFIFSPEVSSVQTLVAAGQAAAKARIDQMAAQDFSKAVAVNLLQDYEKTCEVHTIRRLVNESLVSAKPVATFAADDTQTVLLRAATKDALARVLKVAQINDDQLTALYWLTHNPPTADAEVAVIAQQLAGFADLVDPATGKLKTDAVANATRAAARAALTGLLVASSARLDADVSAMRQTAVPAVASTQPSPGIGVEAAPPPPPPGGNATPTPPRPTAKKNFSPSLNVRVLSSR